MFIYFIKSKHPVEKAAKSQREKMQIYGFAVGAKTYIAVFFDAPSWPIFSLGGNFEKLTLLQIKYLQIIEKQFYTLLKTNLSTINNLIDYQAYHIQVSYNNSTP